MRYIMYGAGALGCLAGSRLQAAGFEVVLIARGEQLHVLQTRGLRVDTAAGSETFQIPTVGHPREITFRGDDVVFLCVKTQDTAAALADLRAACGDADVPVVCMQNGLESERMALRLFPRVYGMVLYLIGSYLEPGVVQYGSEVVTGITDIGRYPSGVDEIARQVAADLETAGLSSRAHPDITRWQYAKLMGIIGNSAQAAAGREVRDVARMLVEEAMACLRAAGLDWASDEEMKERRQGLRSTGNSVPLPGTSAWQSLARGAGSIETDYLDGEITLLGRLHGVATPVAATMQKVARRLVAEGKPPESMTPAELMREIDIARGEGG